LNGQNLLLRIIDCLAETQIPYVIVGSFATNVYAIARSTQDADIVVNAATGQIAALAETLSADFVRDPQVQFETVTATTKTVFTDRETGFILELFQLSDDPHDQERFARRREIIVQGRPTWVLSKEDVLVTKLNWLLRANRTKDLLDVRNVMGVQGDSIEWPYVEKWCDRHGTRELLDRLRSEMKQGLQQRKQ
jgi:hypothetical protein